MPLKFEKMHGLGNDFMVINTIEQPIQLSAKQIRQWADRHTGVGFDQLLLIATSTDAEHDFSYRIYNADGSEVSQCGNGARCFAKYVYDHDLSQSHPLKVQTHQGSLELWQIDTDTIKVSMGIPKWQPDLIPMLAPQQQVKYPLPLKQGNITIGAVGLGNPHAVIQVEDIKQAPVQTLGTEIETHPYFPERVNVGFMQIIQSDRIRLRVFERGVGETFACGSGACAAVLVGQQQRQLDNKVVVELAKGELLIECDGKQSPVWLTGSATHVYQGVIDCEKI